MLQLDSKAEHRISSASGRFAGVICVIFISPWRIVSK
jgi:hypothetical protein